VVVLPLFAGWLCGCVVVSSCFLADCVAVLPLFAGWLCGCVVVSSCFLADCVVVLPLFAGWLCGCCYYWVVWLFFLCLLTG
jgi:hypothetical protein